MISLLWDNTINMINKEEETSMLVLHYCIGSNVKRNKLNISEFKKISRHKNNCGQNYDYCYMKAV